MFALKMGFAELQKRLELVPVSAAFPEEDLEEMKTRIRQREKAAEREPERASGIWREAQQELETFLDGRTPEASFHLVSDVHAAARPDTADCWRTALQDMRRVHPESNIAVVTAGDMTANGRPEQYAEFYDIYRECWGKEAEKTLHLLGNHDVRGWQPAGWSIYPREGCAVWPQERQRYLEYNAPYMPGEAKQTLYHSKILGGYTFLMFNTTVGIKDAMVMSPEMILWFEQKMKESYEADPDRPVFIVSHQPLNNTHWRSNVLEGFDGLGNEMGTGPSGITRDYSNQADRQVKAILQKYPVGVFLSGHIHNQFGMAEVQLRKYGVMVDIPSFGQPELGIPEPGTGFEVELFRDQLILRARNFAKGQWLPEYDTVLPLPLLPGVWASARDTEAGRKAARWMDRTYDQEGMPWDWLGMPEQRLFDRPVLEKLEALRARMEAEALESGGKHGTE